MELENLSGYSRVFPLIHTCELGRVLGMHIKAGQVIALQGELGAGKTTFTQGLAEGMGIKDRVTSPTFTLVNEYGSGDQLSLIHVDTYRLGDLDEDALLESSTFGLEEMLDPANLADSTGYGAAVVVEWAERVSALLPSDHLLIQIEANDDDDVLRTVTCTASGPQSAELCHTLDFVA